MSALGVGHACADMGQGAVPALLPFLIDARGWSVGMASVLVLAVSISSSVIQPIFGHWSDRRSLPWLMPGGLLLEGVGLALAGLTTGYAATIAAVTIAGLGIAAFHPEGSRYANYVSGSRRATGMSLFSVGGNVGFALGPVLVTPLVLLLGVEGMAVVGAVPVLWAAALAFELSRLQTFRPAAGAGGPGSSASNAGPDRWGPFARLGGVVAQRTVLYFALMTFVPVWFVHHLHTSKATGNAALAVMLACGAIGTLIGGRLADRIGRRPILIGANVVLIPLVLLFPFLGAGGAILLLVPIGMATIATFSTTVVLGQEYLPGRIGVASGVTLGLAIGLGGVAAAGLGALADATSLRLVLSLLPILPVGALLLSLTLPDAHAARAAKRSGPAPVSVRA